MSEGTTEGKSRQKERRTQRRTPVEGMLVWSDDIKGRVLNLSKTGMSIATSCSVDVGQYVSFRAVGERHSIVSAEVRWVQEDSVVEVGPDGEPTAIYHVGLMFLHDPHELPPRETESDSTKKSSTKKRSTKKRSSSAKRKSKA